MNENSIAIKIIQITIDIKKHLSYLTNKIGMWFSILCRKRCGGIANLSQPHVQKCLMV